MLFMSGLREKPESAWVVTVGLLLSLVGCANQQTDQYNGCALGVGGAGLAIGLAATGTGAAVVGAAGGGVVGYLLCREHIEAPDIIVAAEPVEPLIAEPVPVVDLDGDGITDDRDECADTAAGAAVDYSGCPLPIVFNTVIVRFAEGDALLSDEALGNLNEAAVYMTANPNTHYDIGGHTDSQGSDACNEALALRRAHRVYEALLAQGVDARQLSVSGYGKTQPLSTNETAAGRGRNRRVEIRRVN